jgi:formate--tetrahydrofolate ligase
MYGAEAVDYQLRARRDKAQLEKLGFGNLPVCIAKTQSSLSDNPALLGRPKDFLVTVREIQLAAGAGYIVPITGEIMRMPGLPKVPLAERFDLSSEGAIVFRPADVPAVTPLPAPAPGPARAAAASSE